MSKKDKWITRIVCFALLATIILIAIINGVNEKKTEPKDSNIYLNEEICFADNVYIKVDKMNVTENENENAQDNDGDKLSKYILNLELTIQRRSDNKKNNEIEIKPKMFQLKNVNLKSKNKMAVFFESMAKATLSALVSGTVNGEINIIEETIGFAGEYISESINNAKTLKGKFKPIDADSNSFENFSLGNQSEPVNVKLHFPIKQEYIDSENVIVLAVDAWNHYEKRIFLIPRPKSN